ncbi:hypothetical protein CTO_0990 [Chlamydia trachomatis A2497]|uniref:Uncharacterized protein n=1 Tax=Chlamydia trachomatis serovar A (strain A2497) TaxID=580047 RepID=G4NN01_CHLT4|nr:hypothetical protein E150_03315 [Chlamydia trachomatis E/150]ADH18336.1 hypothetical protein G9768_03285 [Chlamydia trachomatis G/9768]ADH19260.1 hypothetical protein G11222_03305 [Chlamydia trachomatis G/11222]ADH20183.1 hypothetical protein G11074_03285 [Chlamydia trachomatis G/11074]ADH97282.1 hypothetical protein CTG9301_03300 [Chlamydia trachomatis G/9301]AEP35499.1 hypothetical protein CTO_0990 [Chlamydia trachomatis A2497]AGT70454.1 hypothetical protein O177_03425 [Chlamydia trachom
MFFEASLLRGFFFHKERGEKLLLLTLANFL